MKKRLLAFLLAVVLTVSCLPHVVLAEGTQTEQSEQETTLENVTPAAIPEPHSHAQNSHVCEDCQDDDVVWTAWAPATNNELPRENGHYYLTCNISLNNINLTCDVTGKDIVICLNGYTVNCNAGRRAIKLNNSNLTIVDCTAYTDADGNYVAGEITNGKTGNGGLAYIAGTSTFKMLAGKLTNSTSTETVAGGWAGGAINARDTAKIILKNCEISGNTCASEGGAIAMRGKATLEMDGVTIRNNTATKGGAIYLNDATNTATLTNCIIEGNSATADAGGAIFSSGAVTMTGCTFKDNSAKTNAGAVFMWGNQLTATDCTFKGNEAKNSGGAVRLTNSCAATFTGCTFEENTAVNKGGAIQVETATATLNNCTFKDNVCDADSGKGGAIFAGGVKSGDKQTTGTVRINGGSFVNTNDGVKDAKDGGFVYLNNIGQCYVDVYKDAEGNTHKAVFEGAMCDRGGAFYLVTNSSTYLEFRDGTIRSCTARNGGAVVAEGGVTAKIMNGDIQDNTATAKGGAFWVNDKAILIWEKARINNNTAKTGGAVYLEPNVTLRARSGEMKGNSASDATSGGAIHACEGTKLQMELHGDMTITGNTTGDKTNNIHLIGSQMISWNTAKWTTKNATIGITADSARAISDTMSQDVSKFFISDVPGMAVVKDEDKLFFKEGHAHSDEPDVVWIPVTGTTLPTESGHYCLTGNIQLTATCTLKGDADVTLCLNSFTIDAQGARRVFTLEGNSKLTIVDCQAHTDADGNYIAGGLTNGKSQPSGLVWAQGDSVFQMLAGKLTNGQGTEATGGGWAAGVIRADSNAQIILKNCEISGNQSASEGGAIVLRNSATAEIEDVTFLNNTATTKGGAIYMNDKSNKVTLTNCSFESNTAANGGAIYSNGGELTVNGGSFTGNSATEHGGAAYLDNTKATLSGDVSITKNTAAKFGGAFYLLHSGTSLTMENGTISDNSADNAGAIILVEAARFQMNGGSISNNKAARKGGAIYLNSKGATACLAGGTISGNTAANGGAIYQEANVNTLILQGITITDNKATAKGGAIYCGTDSVLQVELISNVEIFSNTAADAASNVYLSAAQVITFANVGEGTGKIGVNTDQIDLPCAISNDMGDKDLTAYFVTDEAYRIITNEGGKLYLNYTQGHQHCDCAKLGGDYCKHTNNVWIPWQSTTSLPNTSGHYYLLNDVKVSSMRLIREDVDIVLCLNGHTVDAQGSSRLYSMYDSTKLTITDCTAHTDKDGKYVAGTLTNGKAEVGGLFLLQNSTSIQLFGIKMTNNNDIQTAEVEGYSGGVLHARDNANVLVVGCEMNDNHTTAEGGIICLRDKAVLTMDGVTAQNNKADRKGGVIYSANTGVTITLKDCVFENNASVGDAGGVVLGNGTFEVSGCTFNNNTAKNNAGAILKYGGKLALTDSTFTGNTGINGGALRITSNCDATISNCTFTENTATSNGGAISADSATAILEQNTFSKNSAATGGAMHFAGKEKTLTILSGTFSDNVAPDGGGAIMLYNHASMVLKDGTFSGNVSEKNNGGAIYVSTNCTMTMDGGKISGNQGASYGGGIYALGSTLTINGGEISGNKAGNGAGVAGRSGFRTVDGKHVRDVPTAIIMNGGVICDNEATETGGGGAIYDTGSTFTMHGGEFRGNKAANGGAFIVLARGKLILKDGTFTKNSCTSNGGAIYVSREGEFIMDGGKIIENHADKEGGAIKLYAAKMTLNGGEISKNDCKKYGSAIQTSNDRSKDNPLVSELVINGGTISNNRAAEGGAVYLISGKGTMTGGKIINNYTPKSAGGVLLVTKATFTMSGGSISGNRADITCGGFYLGGESSLTMTGGSISGNSCKGNGAGIYATERSTLNLRGGSISGNSNESSGGGVYAAGSTLGLYGTYIGGNYAKTNGGGVTVISCVIKKTQEKIQPKTTIDGSTIANNSTDGPAGGILLQSKGETYFKSGIIESNESKGNGAGIFVSTEHTLYMSGGEVRNNKAGGHGGGIYHYQSIGVYTGGKIHHNEAANVGGGMYVKGGKKNIATVDLKNLAVTDNTAKQCGGLWVNDENVRPRAENCEFSRNIATTVNTGAIYIPWGIYQGVDFIGCTFADNTSADIGGAVYTRHGCRITFTDCVFTGNQSGKRGGAIFTMSPVIFNNCSFTNNTAAENGGAVYLDKIASTNMNTDVVMRINGGTLEGNISGGQGGAIYLATGTEAAVDGATIKNNTSKLEGSAIWAIDNSTLLNLTVTGNISENGGYAIYYGDSDYDKFGYYRGVHKTGGQMIVKDNKGGDVYYGEMVALGVDTQGLIGDTYMNITLHSGLLTQSLFGVYNYEGGNCQYTVTTGDRSVTEPEFDATMLPQQDPVEDPTSPAGEQNTNAINPVVFIGGGAMAAVIAAVAIIIVAVSKKKKTVASK